MNDAPRVAFLADSFHEVNGAALTCRQLDAFAGRRGYPFLSVRFAAAESFREDGNHWALELKRSRLAVPVDPDLYFDPLFYRLRKRIDERLKAFRPQIIHITSPGDLGILGAIAAKAFRVPLVLSWHTNLHEFAARRVQRTLGAGMARWTERFVLNRVVWFFGRGKVMLAPNEELITMLRERTGKPVFAMGRGIDTEMYSPSRRTRTDDAFVVGYVGRLMPEKNVRFLKQIEDAFVREGIGNYRFLICGSGSEQEWLKANLKQAELAGVVRGEKLAEAYANMDVFAFPSYTDTFGNVVQEAAASGVPAVVTNAGGPKFLVEPGVTGFVAENEQDFVDRVLLLARDRGRQKAMAEASRERSLNKSWDRVFETVYEAYRVALR